MEVRCKSIVSQFGANVQSGVSVRTRYAGHARPQTAESGGQAARLAARVVDSPRPDPGLGSPRSPANRDQEMSSGVFDDLSAARLFDAGPRRSRVSDRLSVRYLGSKARVL